MNRMFVVVMLVSTAAWPRARPTETKEVPTQSVIENLIGQSARRPGDAKIWLNLGRAYALSIAQPDGSLRLEAGTEAIFWGCGFAEQFEFALPFEARWGPAALRAPGALNALDLAIAAFRTSLRLDPANRSVALGLAWLFERKGDLPEAIARYRAFIQAAYDSEKANLSTFSAWLRFYFSSGYVPSGIEEAASYLVMLLNPVTDGPEITKLSRMIRLSKNVGQWSVSLRCRSE